MELIVRDTKIYAYTGGKDVNLLELEREGTSRLGLKVASATKGRDGKAGTVTIHAHAKTGAHALKLQTYTADTMTIDAPQAEFSIRDKKSLWNDEKLYDLYKKAYTPWEWHAPIMKHAASCETLKTTCVRQSLPAKPA